MPVYICAICERATSQVVQHEHNFWLGQRLRRAPSSATAADGVKVLGGAPGHKSVASHGGALKGKPVENMTCRATLCHDVPHHRLCHNAREPHLPCPQ